MLGNTSKASVSTPGVHHDREVNNWDMKWVSRTLKSTGFCQDRSDIKFATKELSRLMANPVGFDWVPM